MSISVKTKVNNKSISYRVDGFTSKFTIHPTLFLALVHKQGSETKARETLRDLGAESHTMGVSATSYVREAVMKKLFPETTKNCTTLDLIELKFKLTEDSKSLKKSKSSTSALTMGEGMLALCKKYEDERSETKPLSSLMNDLYVEHNGRDVSFHLKDNLLKQFAFH